MRDDGKEQELTSELAWVGTAAKDVSSSQMIMCQLVCQEQKNKWEKQSSQRLDLNAFWAKGTQFNL